MYSGRSNSGFQGFVSCKRGFEQLAALALLGGSWYFLTNYSCTYNPLSALIWFKLGNKYHEPPSSLWPEQFNCSRSMPGVNALGFT